MSHQTGFAPAFTDASAVAKNVNEGTTTSSPGWTPSALSASVIASVPLATPMRARRRCSPRTRARTLDLGTEDVAAAGDHGAEPLVERGHISLMGGSEEGDGHYRPVR